MRRHLFRSFARGPILRVAQFSQQLFMLSAESGAFQLTGQPAILKKAYRLAAGAGSFALTGTAAALRKGRVVVAGSGAFALTGSATTLRVARRLAAAAGSFTLTGQTAALRVARRLSAAAGSYALSGQTAALRVSRRLTAAAGSFALSGQSATLRVSRRIAAAAGSYALTGTDATLTKSGTFTLINLTGLTLSGDMTGQAGLAAARDGTTSQTRANSAAKSAGDRSSATWRVDLGSGVTKKLGKVEAWGASDAQGFSELAENVTITMSGSNNNFSSSTVVFTSSAFGTVAGQTFSASTGFDTSTAYRYFEFKLTKASTTSDAILAEIKLYEV